MNPTKQGKERLKFDMMLLVKSLQIEFQSYP